MRTVERAPSARLARRALLARKEKIASVAATLRRSEGEVETVLAALQAAEARELAEIDAALQRVARGDYGWCERCGGDIGPLRLHALPEARLCMGCAGQR